MRGRSALLLVFLILFGILVAEAALALMRPVRKEGRLACLPAAVAVGALASWASYALARRLPRTRIRG